MTYLYCHECKEERTAIFNYDPIDATMIVTCNYCDAAWAFETTLSYQISGPDTDKVLQQELEE